MLSFRLKKQSSKNVVDTNFNEEKNKIRQQIQEEIEKDATDQPSNL